LTVVQHIVIHPLLPDETRYHLSEKKKKRYARRKDSRSVNDNALTSMRKVELEKKKKWMNIVISLFFSRVFSSTQL
jgi:hypothetical protein